MRQREHVPPRCDRGAAGADEISRMLLAVDETRRQRLATVALLAGDPDTPLGGLSARLRVTPTPAFTRAVRVGSRRPPTQRRPRSTTRLRRAVESGEAFLQALFSSVGTGDATYRPDGREDVARAA